MSHELFELFGMLGAGVGLSALFHRAVQPMLLRLATGAAAPLRASARRRQARAGSGASPAEPRDASPRRLDSAI